MRKLPFITFLTAAICLVLLFGAITVFESKHRSAGWEGPFFFIQMADPQFGFFTGNKGFDRETELFGAAIAHANRLKPAFVVVCGDLINQSGKEAQIKEYHRIVGQLDHNIPLYSVSGNHDLHNVPTAQTLADYRGAFGPDWYSVEHGGCRFIVLNSTLISRPDNLPGESQAQWDWLISQLEQAAAEESTHIILFQHHSWFISHPEETDQFFNIPQVRRRVYLDLFRQHGVRAAFAGHYHRNAYARDGGLEMVTSGPVGRPLGPDPSGIRVVKIYEDRIEHQYYGMDSVPQAITLGAKGNMEPDDDI